MSAWLLILLVAVTLALLVRFVRPTRQGIRFGTPPSTEKQWEEKVLLLTRGNREAMERALKARRQKHPQASRAELLQMVHDEYLRDRRA